jgi:23S rRNA G2069 N7-methylase RlmK/C1962 C5-methylase RlmI
MDKTAAQEELLFNRLAKRYRHLKKWARRTGTNAFRLYDRDIPEIPLVLDLYDDAIAGALYKRPYEKDDEEAWLCAMRAAAARAVNIPETRVFLKVRQRMRHRQEEGLQYGKFSRRSFDNGNIDERSFCNGKIAERHFYRDVREGDLIFMVNLSDYLDTGLFLDARKKRALIRAVAADKRVLNLFAYTCSLSVCAAKGGASQVDSVDLSNTYLEWGKVNFALNGLEARNARSPGGFSLIRNDALQFINHARKSGLRWDIIILDPPSFSNSKKMRGTIDLRRDHLELIRKSLCLLTLGGSLWFSSNVKGVRIDAGDFPGIGVKDMGKELVDEDFRGKRMPVCYTLTKL